MIHRCERPDIETRTDDKFICIECGATYYLTLGPRHGFLWLKRNWIWKRR